LKLWVAVLTEACQASTDDEQNDDKGNQFTNATEDQLLRSLIFPLTQVILGTIRLIPATRYLPLRLNCVRLLQQLAAAAELFLPTTSILLDVLDLSEVSQPPKRVQTRTVQPLALTLKLRADNPLRSMEELEMCLAEVFVLLNRELDLYQYSAGFPEFSVRISQRLRKFAKDTRNGRWRAYAKGCLEVCTRYSTTAMHDRATNPVLQDLAPKDIKLLEVLRPPTVPRMGRRHKISLDKEKALDMANKPVQAKGVGTHPRPTTVADAKEEDADDDADPNNKKRKKNKRRKRQLATANALLDQNRDALAQQDEVEDGINWSDDE